MKLMPAIEKHKLCWNCEATVSRGARNCPYCGVYLHPEEESVQEEPALSSNRYDPPYTPPKHQEGHSAVAQAPYPHHESMSSTSAQRDAHEPLSLSQKNWQQVVIPLGLLLSGSVFFLFSILMSLFSHNGLFTLQWDASYWYIYLLLALPLLYFGWQSLQSLEEEDNKS